MNVHSGWGFRLSIFLAVLGAVGFLIVTLIVRADLLRQLDFNITVKLQHHMPRRLDTVGIWLGTLAQFQIIVPFLIGMLCLFRRWLIVVSSLVLLLGSHLLEIVGKALLFQPPPPFMFYRHPTEFLFPDSHTFNESSYPSGHSMRVTFMAMTLGLLVWQQQKLPTWLKLGLLLILVGFTFITILTRITLGEHWMSDVIGGAFLGLFIGSINWALMSQDTT